MSSRCSRQRRTSPSARPPSWTGSGTAPTRAAPTSWRSTSVLFAGRSTAPSAGPVSKPCPAGPICSAPTERDCGHRRCLWLRPQTVRVRATAAVALVASLALAACSVVLLYAVHTNLVASAQNTARDHVDKAAHQLGSGTPPADVQAALPDIILDTAP